MKNFNSILSILLSDLVKYENEVNKIFIIVDDTLKNYSNIKHKEYNANKLIIADKLTQIQGKPDEYDINSIISALSDIYNIKQLICTNFEIVTIKQVLHIIKNAYSETKTNRIDKKILTTTNILNNLMKCEYVFVNSLVQLFVDYFNETNTYIVISDFILYGLTGYINKIIIGIINFYKYDSEYTERNKQITQLLYNSVYKSAGFGDKTDNSDDIWYVSSDKPNGVVYKLENLLTAETPALHNVNGLSDLIVNKLNTIVITPIPQTKYKIMKNYSDIYVRNYLREELMNTENIKFADPTLLMETYTEWKVNTDIVPNILIQNLANNFNKILEQSKIVTFQDFVNLIGCIEPIQKDNIKVTNYNSYIFQSFSEFYSENINKLIATQFVSTHTNALFDDQTASDNNFMKEAYISNLSNIKASSMILQKKIIEAATNIYKSEIYVILKYNSNRSDAWLSLFKTIIKTIVDPGKNVKSKFVEKINVLIPSASFKYYVMKNPNTLFKLNI